ncbi:MAG: hypothetical protein ACTSVL_10205 [Promethearchaeota archaeon]
MSTSLSRKFNYLVKEGMKKYQEAVDAKSANLTLKKARNALKTFNETIEIAKYINAEDKVKYINEYFTLTHVLIANSQIDLKNYDQADESLKIAEEFNLKTLENEETIIRDLFIHSKLMDLAKLRHDNHVLEKCADYNFKKAQKLQKPDKTLEYLRESANNFVILGKIDQAKKVFKKILKICKNKKTNKELHKTIAGIYEEYADFCLKYEQGEDTAKKYFIRAKDIYKEIKMKKNVEIIGRKLSKIA